MADIKWIKIDTGLFNNRKIRQIERLENGDSLILIWLKMLILAAEVNEDGFTKAGTVYSISNWEKYQNIDGMERIREQNRLRKQRERERKRDIDSDGHVTGRDSHDTDKDKEVDKDKIIKKRTVFVPPTVDEVKAYCDERNNKIDPQAFIDFYDSKGWMIGANKMKDWRAAVRTWERKENKPAMTTKQHFENQNSYDFADLEKKLLGG